MARILIAEAHPQHRAALAHALDDQHELIHVVHGQAALAQLRARTCDVALLALDLPLLPGAELAAMLGESGSPTLVVVQGAPGDELTTAGRLDNVVATLARPVAAIDVQRAVRRCVRPSAITTIPPDSSGPIERAPRVLVVDDDPGLRAALEDVLGQSFEVFTAPDGPTAVRLARARRFDAVLVDLQMPLVDGEWTVQRLRDVLPDAKMLLMSGHDRVVAVGRRLGAGVVRKPFDGEALRARLRRAVIPR